LDAARAAFSDRGFTGATIRDIAQRAGVAHGLVLRHFTSKEALFLAAVPGIRDLTEHVAGDAAGLPERVAHAFVQRMEAADSADPFLALIRSSADQEAARRLLGAIRDCALAAYRMVLDLPDLEQRVDLLGSQLIGVTFSRYVMKDGPLAGMAPEQLTRYLTVVIAGILFAPLPDDAAAASA
jgi:AcrR family transcriptional regulator